MLGECVDARLVPDGEVEPRRAGGRRGHQLRERGRRCADEPAGGEHVERPSPLADEVRRRLEPRPPADAAARQQRHPIVAEVPGGGLGGVPGVCVLGEQADERAVEVKVERREDERQCRLRNPRGGGLGKPGRERR